MAVVPIGRERVQVATTAARRSKFSLTPYLFILPHLVFFTLFVAYPLVYGLYISLFNFDFAFPNFRPFVGLDNYTRLFTGGTPQNEDFWRGVRNTLTFVVFSVPPMILLPLGLAVLLNGNYRGRNFFRALFFAPYALSPVVASTLWWWIFQDTGGLINHVAQQLGLPTVSWLTAGKPVPNWTAITVATVWWTCGFNTIILLAALQEVPVALYEAAAIDGANRWQQFARVTLPLLRPVLIFIVTIQIIASFNLFAQPLIMATRDNLDARSIIMVITEEGIRSNRMGSAAAMSVVTAVLMIAVTYASNRLLLARRVEATLGERR
jgi:multiple sugar transport system permease protein